MKILGAGLPRTGTATLCEALRILGYNAVHHEPEMLPLYPDETTDWRAYDYVEAVTDAPAAIYWRELTREYRPKVILTIRETSEWWESIKRHANQIRTGADIEHIRYTEALHSLLFGSPQPCEYWYKRRFWEHNAMVRSTIKHPDLLVMDIVGGDKWDKLCPFLGIEDEPSGEEWPWKNKAR